MADIGSLNTFEPSAARSLGTERPVQTLEQERIQAELQRQAGGNIADVETESREAARVREADSGSSPNGEAQAEAGLGSDGDQVVLSQEAVQALANDNATISPVTIGQVNPTNQQVQDESSSAQVDGNQDNRSEQERTLGQFVDQFA